MKVPLPTKTELQRLPQAAVLLLVAQCLRRIKPIIRSITPDPVVAATFHEAIEVVEGYANGRVPSKQDCVQLCSELTELWNSAHEYTLSSDLRYHLQDALAAAELGVCIPFDALNDPDHQLAFTARMSIERSLKALACASSVRFYEIGFDIECLPEAREVREEFELLSRNFKAFKANSQIITAAKFFDEKQHQKGGHRIGPILRIWKWFQMKKVRRDVDGRSS